MSYRDRPTRASLAFALAALATFLLGSMLLTACTSIDRLNINTVAVNCDVSRSDAKDAAASGDASVLERQGEAAGQFVGSLRSTIRCRDVAVEADVDGTVADQ